jgi:predicted double-glycine peptidase
MQLQLLKEMSNRSKGLNKQVEANNESDINNTSILYVLWEYKDFEHTTKIRAVSTVENTE